jgi:hypothetical protein
LEANQSTINNQSFEPDPREIGPAFHRAGAEIGEKGGFFKGLKSTDPAMSQPLVLSIGEDIYYFSTTDARLDLLPKMYIE